MADQETITDTFPTFFAGWRPLVGWICVVALAIEFIAIPVVETVMAIRSKPVDIHGIELSPLITLVTTVLGLGGMRTIEKIKDVQDKH